MSLKEQLRLYIITDRKLRDEVETVEEALKGGASAIQLRLKNVSTREMLKTGDKLRELTTQYGALFFVNDRLDVALACEADGVQLGPEDMPISKAKDLAPDLIIGASVYSLEEALNAVKEGADYLGAGAVFPTNTKDDARVLGLEGLKDIANVVNVPVVAIGGINRENIQEVLKAGVDGVAVVSAVAGDPDVRQATKELQAIIDKFFAKSKF